MADPVETVYAADAHTKAKHAILREYLQRWFIILGRAAARYRTTERLLYVDGFAGAGEYRDDVPGSPLVAIETAREQRNSLHVPLHVTTIELREDRVQHLKRLTDTIKCSPTFPANIRVDDPIQGECEEEICRILHDHEARHRAVGPAFFFLDQFGYSAFSMDLVSKILKHPKCEVFSYLNWQMACAFMGDETKWRGISEAFGGDEWKAAIPRSGQEKEEAFRQAYMNALRERGGAKYVFEFVMRDHNDRIIYWLFFSTNSLQGLEEMKEAMWKVDGSGGFQFSDKHAGMGNLFSYEPEKLAEDLVKALDGKEMAILQIHEYAMTSTPAYRWKEALGMLRKSGELQRVGTTAPMPTNFNDETIRVRIARKEKPAPRPPEPTLF